MTIIPDMRFSPTLLIIVLIFLLSVSSAFSGSYLNFAGIYFVDIPKGSFFMGSCTEEAINTGQKQCRDKALLDKNAYHDEAPRHSVDISRKIQIGAHEVSVRQFMQFLQASHPHELSMNKDFILFNNNGDDKPVTCVSWYDTQAFLSWLNKAKPAEDTGSYRLPTEAEWEYIARAGFVDIYFFGNPNDLLGQYAWFTADNSTKKRPTLQPIGTKKANPWGVFDMYGNVWEWASDWYNPAYYQTSRKKDPVAEDSGLKRVIRGGAFNFDSKSCRSAARESYPPYNRSRSIGFRVIRELPE